MASIGCLRKHTGRNESEPMCSVVRVSIRAGGWFGSVEPFQTWLRLVCSVEGQEFHITAGGIGTGNPDFSPRVCVMRTEQLLGVAGMACMDSCRVNHGRSGHGLCSRQSNPPYGKECQIQKSEQLIVVVTAGTTQPCQSEGAVRLQYLFESKTADVVLKEVSHVR